MGADTKIEWADCTFNPWVGCTAVSPACDSCYAERLAKRLGVAWGPHAERRRTSESNWRQPLAWNRKAQREGRRYRVFCASLADVFDNQVPIEWLVDLLDVVRTTEHLDWLLLTKRPQLIRRRLEEALAHLARGSDRGDLLEWLAGWLHGRPPSNVWLGTTVENQAEADRRIPRLLAVPAARHFLSCEPLLGPVRLDRLPHGDESDLDALRGQIVFTPQHVAVRTEPLGARIDWIIAGGESGPHARPSHPDWFRSLRDQCASAGVPFFFKQWGEWIEADQQDAAGRPVRETWTGSGADGQGGLHWWLHGHADWSVRLPKKETGALLDGREWREVPA